MKRIQLTIALSFTILLSFSQTYDEIKGSLPTHTCNNSPSAEECRTGIQTIENWMLENPRFITAKAYYDLQNYYYVLAAKDSSVKQLNYEKCIQYNLKYTELAGSKEKYLGYWNSTICYSTLKDCPNTLKYLALAKENYSGKKKYWDHSSENVILTKICNK